MDWFERITGFPEDSYKETRARLRVENARLLNERDGTSHAVGELELPSLGELRARTSGIPGCGALRLDILEGDVRKLHTDPENEGATFQVASQFNLLEMVGPDVTPEHGVSRYVYDRTQGPACAIAAGAGTIWRNYLAPVGDQVGQTADRQIDGLADLGAALMQGMGSATPLWLMRNGYALPDRDRLVEIEAYIAALDEAGRDDLRARLRVGLHRDVGVTEPGAATDARVTQVYASALPVAYSGIGAEQWSGLGALVLEAAYEATLHAAVLNVARGGSRRVLLTRLGGGAFGNDEGWISNAILQALSLFEDHDLEVLMVSHGPPSRAIREVAAEWAGKAHKTGDCDKR
jgi:hypothetical protein